MGGFSTDRRHSTSQYLLALYLTEKVWGSTLPLKWRPRFWQVMTLRLNYYNLGTLERQEMATEIQEKPLVVDVHGVAAMLDCSWRTVYRLVADGLLPPPIQLGRLRKWRRETIEEWLVEASAK